MTITMYDSVDLSQLPADDGHFMVGAYTAGWFLTFPAAVTRYGRARVLSIAIAARFDADCLDIETGDATPADAPGWVARQHARGVTRPVLYANRSTMPAVQAAMNGAGIARSSYRLWVAQYVYTPMLPAGFDGCQFTDRALGHNLDQSEWADNAFTGGQPPPTPVSKEKDMPSVQTLPIPVEAPRSVVVGIPPSGINGYGQVWASFSADFADVGLRAWYRDQVGWKPLGTATGAFVATRLGPRNGWALPPGANKLTVGRTDGASTAPASVMIEVLLP